MVLTVIFNGNKDFPFFIIGKESVSYCFYYFVIRAYLFAWLVYLINHQINNFKGHQDSVQGHVGNALVSTNLLIGKSKCNVFIVFFFVLFTEWVVILLILNYSDQLDIRVIELASLYPLKTKIHKFLYIFRKLQPPSVFKKHYTGKK